MEIRVESKIYVDEGGRKKSTKDISDRSYWKTAVTR